MINGSSAKSGVRPIYSPVFCGVSDNTETYSKYIECFVCLFVCVFCVCGIFFFFFFLLFYQNQYISSAWLG